jgi:hypothetical protein
MLREQAEVLLGFQAECAWSWKGVGIFLNRLAIHRDDERHTHVNDATETLGAMRPRDPIIDLQPEPPDCRIDLLEPHPASPEVIRHFFPVLNVSPFQPLIMVAFLNQILRPRQTDPATSPLQQANDKDPNVSIVALEPTTAGIVQQQPLLFQQSVEYHGHDGYESSAPGKPWKPLMLRHWVLLVLAVVFALLIVGLEIVLKVSR